MQRKDPVYKAVRKSDGKVYGSPRDLNTYTTRGKVRKPVVAAKIRVRKDGSPAANLHRDTERHHGISISSGAWRKIASTINASKIYMLDQAIEKCMRNGIRKIDASNVDGVLQAYF